MAASSRRLAFRLNLAVLAVAVALPAAAVTASAAAPTRLTIAAHVGYHDTVKLGDWMPLTIDITNNGPNLDATVDVVTSSSLGGKGMGPAGAAVYELPLSLAAGATKHLRTHVTEDQQAAVTVQVVDHGRVIASQGATSSNTTTLLIGILSDQAASLGGLASINPGGVSSGVVHLAPADLPDTGLLLRPFDLLAIDDFATDVLTAAQRAAIGDYVMNGGALLLGGGGSWRKTLSGLPPAVVPIEVTGSRILPSSAPLGGLSGIEVATGPVSGKTAVWLSDGPQPLVVESAVGQGWVEMATFDWNQDSVAGWKGTSALLRQAFVRSSFGVNAAQVAAGGGASGGSAAQRGNAFSQVLSNLPSLDLPAWWLIGSLIVLYVLLIGPVNFFVLRAVNHRALAWITVPTIAIVAAGGAYGIASVTKGRSVQVNEVSIVHVASGWESAYQEAYTGILTPTRGDYDVGLTGGTALVSSLSNYNGGPVDTSQSLIRVDPTGAVITLPGMTAFNLRDFATERITAAPRLVTHATLVGGKLTGTIENQSSSSFTDGVVIAGDGYQTFGKLAPGATVAFSVTPSVGNLLNGPPTFMQIYPSNNFIGPQGPGSASSDAMREGTARTTVLSVLPVNGIKGISLSAAPMVVVWSDQPFENVVVNGAHPRSYALTGVVLAVPIEAVDAGKLPSGVVPGRLIDVEGDIQQNGGPPGTVLMTSGVLTYDFMPPLTTGGHMANVTIDSSNPFGGKAPIAPAGASGAVKGQAWDWATSAWVDVTYQDGGSTSVPDAAVNPATGEVRLRLSSDGAYGSGWLSLAGTVK